MGLAGPEARGWAALRVAAGCALERSGLRSWAGNGLRGKGLIFSSFFQIPIPFLKQANKFEFKPGFESKHSKTMHQHAMQQ
jgi:hypothetical protein